MSSLERSLPLYRELLRPLGYTELYEVVGERGEPVWDLDGEGVGASLSLREAQTETDGPYDRYSVGLHHLAFEAASREAVDERLAWARSTGTPHRERAAGVAVRRGLLRRFLPRPRRDEARSRVRAVSESSGSPDTRSQRERMLAGDLYIADDPVLAQESGQAHTLMHEFNTSAPSETALRRRLLAQLLGSIGEGTEIRAPLYVDYGYNLHIGARTFANFGLVALDVAPITIGDDVQIGTNVQLLTPTHPLEPEPRRAKWEAAEPITIGDNVWLGGGVIVCPGVEIGADTVVGAGAVVTRDLPAGVLALGVPARVVRPLV